MTAHHRPTTPNGDTPTMRRTLLATLLVAALAACGGDDEAPQAAIPEDAVDHTGEDAVAVLVRDNSFDDQHIVVSAGTEVTFENKGRNAHNALPVEDGAFEAVPVDDLQPGDSGSVVFDRPGQYPYYCSLHGTETAGMVGTVVVVD